MMTRSKLGSAEHSAEALGRAVAVRLLGCTGAHQVDVLLSLYTELSIQLQQAYALKASEAKLKAEREAGWAAEEAGNLLKCKVRDALGGHL